RIAWACRPLRPSAGMRGGTGKPRDRGDFASSASDRSFVADGKEPWSVRSLPGRIRSPSDLRRQVERLEGLPLRAASVRCLLNSPPEAGEPAGEPDCAPQTPAPSVAEFDPGWVLTRGAPGRPFDPLKLIAELPWWPELGGELGDVLTRHWRHAVA